jgi:hypothetical protein
MHGRVMVEVACDHGVCGRGWTKFTLCRGAGAAASRPGQNGGVLSCPELLRGHLL